MGTFATGWLVLNISNRKRSARLSNLLVDTGSEATWIPRRVLQEIGVASVKKASFRMANGLIHRDVGYAAVRVGKSETVDDLVFAEAGDFAILGARALEGLNLWVDAAGKRLVPGRAWPLESVIVGGGKVRMGRQKKVAVAHSAPVNLPVTPAPPEKESSPFMTQVLKAIFDGKVIRPRGRVNGPAHSSIEIVIRTPRKKAKPAPYSSLRLAASLKLKGRKDFSENPDEYLYRKKTV